MANEKSIVEGTIEAVAPDKCSFLVGDDWYRVKKDTDMKQFQKGEFITFESGESEREYKGKTYKTLWANNWQISESDAMTDIDDSQWDIDEHKPKGNGSGHQQRLDEAPPVGKYPSKGNFEDTQFKIDHSVAWQRAFEWCIATGDADLADLKSRAKYLYQEYLESRKECGGK